MFIIVACILVAILIWLQFRARSNVGKSSSNNAFLNLQWRFFAVYFPATFADWLQGPYLYKLYSSYGFREDEIFMLYIAGFASSFTFGTCISVLADYFGRRKMCILFDVVYVFSCLSKLSTNFKVLALGRVLGGIGSSILFSVFEAWYVYQHVEKHQFPVTWINNTLSKATFCNGFFAIISGIVSSVLVDVLDMGPVIPFMLAVPFLVISGIAAVLMWDEVRTLRNMKCFDIFNMLKIIFKKDIILLCFIQSIFESVMYMFIILWTPILNPVNPPLGIVFSCFMMAIMIGSILHKWLVSKRHEPKYILTIAMILAALALSMCAASEILFPESSSYVCFFSFLLYEVSVGLYYPVIGFVRSCVLPECYRASLTSWFRLPMNLITCFSLFYFRYFQLVGRNKISTAMNPSKFSNNLGVFATCALALIGAGGMTRNLNVRLEQGGSEC